MNQRLEEFDNYIRNKNVAIIGLGVSNIPLVDYFYDRGARVEVFDNKEFEKIPKEIIDKLEEYQINFSFGKKYLSQLYGFDLIIRSPSCLPTIPELQKAEKEGTIVTTEIELFMKMCPCKIIGVTGSDGKTTTTTLISEILKQGGHKCHTGGNIGIPLFTKLKEMEPDDICVLELSSFQLMGMEISPDIAVMTNITPNHLNIHKDYKEYIEAKKNIFRFQDENGILIANYDNNETRKASKEAKGKVIYFSSKEKLEEGYIIDEDIIKRCEDGLKKCLFNIKETRIIGRHNYENICAALAATENLVVRDVAFNACKTFKGVEHRIEFVREIDGVKWYNDSASSTPSRTLSGLNSFDEEIILIAGGASKNLDYTSIAKAIVDKVKVLILMGETSEEIFIVVEKELKEQSKTMKILMCNDLKQAVILARRNATQGQVVLFSPASTSFDMFKNMYERGDKFKEIVNELR